MHLILIALLFTVAYLIQEYRHTKKEDALQERIRELRKRTPRKKIKVRVEDNERRT